MTLPKHPGLIGPTDSLRQERLLALTSLMRSSRNEVMELRWPDYATQERAALNDLALDGPKTILPLSRQLAGFSQLLRAGVPMVSEMTYQDLVMPTLDRGLEATWGGTSPDIGDSGISAATPNPKRLSAFVIVSDQLRVQNPLLIGAWLEQQLLASIGRAIDKAAIAGDGSGETPVGILSDTDILTNVRASAGVDTLADLAEMEKVVANANGEDSPEDFLWISDTATREILRTTEGIGSPIWSGPGPLGHAGIASVHAPASTLVLAQKSAMAIIDWNKIQVENLVDRAQALQGFRQMHVTGYFDFAILDPNGVCKATDA